MRNFEQRIRSLKTKQNLINIVRSIIQLIMICCIIFILFHFIFHWTNNHQFELFLFALSLKILVVLLVIYYILQTYKDLVSSRSAARFLDKFNQDSSDTFQNAFELKNLNDAASAQLLLKEMVDMSSLTFI